MLRRILVIGLVATALAMPRSSSAQLLGLTQWNSGAGANLHFYAMTQFAGDYREVSAIAESLGGRLVSITSAAENEFVYNTFSPLGTCSPVWCLPSTFYIGLERVSPGGAFAWQTGEAVSFTSWNEGEPNNIGGDEMGTHLFYGNPGTPASGAAPGDGEIIWNDIAYDQYPMRGVIEWTPESVSVPEPSTYALLLSGLLGLGFVTRRRRQDIRG